MVGYGEARWSNSDGMLAKGGMTTRKIELSAGSKGGVNTWKVVRTERRNLGRERRLWESQLC